MTKRLQHLLYLALTILGILVLSFILVHRTTIRFVDKNGASIRTDQVIRLVKLPLCLHVEGYKLKGIRYHKTEHLFSVEYKPSYNPLMQVRRAKYLGVTFQPTTVPIEDGKQGDPFILSRQYDNGRKSGRDTLRILIGNHYGKFRVLSANYPAVSVRDPSIMRQGKTYYIIYTRGLLSTTDFNHWKQINWPAVPEFQYSQDWAPEFVKVDNGKRYVVMSVQKKGDNRHQIMLTYFSKGKVGKKWEPVTGNLPLNAIDPNIQYYNGQFYLFCKNETTRKLIMGTSSNLTGPYRMEKVRVDSSKYGSIEGPEALIHNGAIKLMFDTYDTRKNGEVIFHGLHYTECKIGKSRWSRMKKIQSPIVTRHGQIIINNDLGNSYEKENKSE